MGGWVWGVGVGGLQKYCDILCNYICGIALCWQSQSEVFKMHFKILLCYDLENILLQLCLYWCEFYFSFFFSISEGLQFFAHCS